MESISNINEWISEDLGKSIDNNIKHKNFEEAWNLANELVKIKPWFWYYKLWWIENWQNKTNEAIENFKKAIDLAPNTLKETIQKELNSIEK